MIGDWFDLQILICFFDNNILKYVADQSTDVNVLSFPVTTYVAGTKEEGNHQEDNYEKDHNQKDCYQEDHHKKARCKKDCHQEDYQKDNCQEVSVQLVYFLLDTWILIYRHSMILFAIG